MSDADMREATYWMQLAQSLENGREVQARKDRINRRLQMIRGQWNVPRVEGLHYSVDTSPRIVSERLEDKVVAQPYMVSCRSLIPQTAPMITAEGVVLTPIEQQQQDEALRAAQRAKADKVEAHVRGLVTRMERQQGKDLLRLLANGASRLGFAGPLRLGFDDKAPPGTLPIYFSILNPQCLFVEEASGAGVGPDTVIYKRMATRQALLAEGWPVNDEKLTYSSGSDQMITIYDCWKRVRNGPRTKLWHCILATNAKDGFFLKKPFDMSKLGLLVIPYVFAPVRPDSVQDDDYPEGSSNALIDILDLNWENRCYLLSYQMQLVALAVNPPTIAATRSDMEVDVVTPGAEHQGDQGDKVMEIRSSQARPEIAAAWGYFENQTQRGTFSAASFGSGEHSMSALMTGRLQNASEEPLSPTRSACQLALGSFYGLVALFARLFLQADQHVIELQGSTSGFFDPKLLTGDEIFDVVIPAVSRAEAAQQAASAKALAEPGHDGSRFISYETAREISTLVPYEHQEEERIRREMESVVLYEKMKAEHAAGQERLNQRMEIAKQDMSLQQEALKMRSEQERTAQVRMGAAQAPQPEKGPQVAPHPQGLQPRPQPGPHNPMQPNPGVMPQGS